MESKEFSKYEVARILGARALQIAMNAPLLIKIKQEDLEEIKFDALKIAEIELNSNILPISIKKPLPTKKEGKLKKVAPPKVISDDKKAKLEQEEEKEIVEGGEIMELVNSPDEEDSEALEKPEEQ